MRLLLLASLLLLFPAQGAAYWVRGVTAESGWYDADKEQESDGDFCWAAAAANMTAWWQDRHPELQRRLPDSRGLRALWATYRRCFRPGTGSAYYCLAWWLNDQEPPPQMPLLPAARALRYTGGTPLRAEDLLLEKAPLFHAGQTVDIRLKDLLCEGYAVALGVRCYDARGHLQPGGHMLSLWGLEFDEEQQRITRLYFTDSDDAAPAAPQPTQGLRAADCRTGSFSYAEGPSFTAPVFRACGRFASGCTITTLIALHADAGAEKEK